MFDNIESKLTFFLGEMNDIELYNDPKSFAGALRLKYNNIKKINDYPELDVLRKDILDILDDKSLHISDAKRKKYEMDVMRQKTKENLAWFIWNVILAGDNKKVIK